MQARHRKAVLLTLLAGVGALALLDPAPGGNGKPSSQQPRGAVEASAPSPRGQGPPTVVATVLLERAGLSAPTGDLFGSQSWQPPPPKAVVSPKPSAPPMPYRFAGRLILNGEVQGFLTKGDLPIAVTQGEVVDGMFRVESIAENGITLVHVAPGGKGDEQGGRTFLPATAKPPLN